MLKFDIEYSEWGAIEAMKREGCLKYVRQMVFEIHMWTDEDPKAEELLKNNGFPPIQVLMCIYVCMHDFVYIMGANKCKYKIKIISSGLWTILPGHDDFLSS